MSDTITLCIDKFRQGHSSAANTLWKHLQSHLLRLAKTNLSPAIRRTYDEDDVAQSAFMCLCQGLSAGQFPELNHRNELERLVSVIALRKISARCDYMAGERRNASRVIGETELTAAELGEPLARGASLDNLPAKVVAGELNTEMSETMALLFRALDDPMLQQIAYLRLEGHDMAVIALKINCATRTVRRKFDTIRRRWKPFLEALQPAGACDVSSNEVEYACTIE